MKLKILSSLLILGLMFNVGCTSSNDEAKDTEAADASELDKELPADTDAAVEGADANTEEVAEGDDFATDEEVVADTGDEAVADDGTAQESVKSADAVPSEDLPAESLEDSGDGSKIVAEDGTGSEASEPAPEEGVFDSPTADAPAEAASTSSYAGGEEAPKNIPVKKIADAPFKKNGMLLNTVYLARSGDDLGSISQKIYGSDNKAALIQANPNLSHHVKVGDKVYYNSPKRPQDAEKMLTYYEDNGMAPASYTAKAGDNIRTVSKQLLGNSNSWKEVWATNMGVESKDALPEGTELKYWSEDAVAAAPAPAPEVAAAPDAPQMPEPAPAPEVAAAPSAPAAGDDFALPDDMANNGGAAAAAGTVANEPPPPPPPPSAPAQKTVASSSEKDMTFMLSAGGLLLVGVGVLLGIIRKGRARKMSMNTHTQI
jgi:hypothetical protein